MPLPIETPRLLLRPFTLDDAPAIHELTSDPEVVRYTARPVPTADVSDVMPRLARWIAYQEAHGFGVWAVQENEGGLVVGQCGLYEVEFKGPDVEVAYVLRRDRWGRGYATEAAAAALRFGFEELGLRRIVALIVPANTASIRVAEKLGMRREGRARHYDLDLVRYARGR